MIKNLVEKLRAMNGECKSEFMTSPFVSDNATSIKTLKGMSKSALNLYVKKNDIKKFTKLALSNPEDDSHEDIIENLFRTGIAKDYFDHKHISNLSKNTSLLKELGL